MIEFSMDFIRGMGLAIEFPDCRDVPEWDFCMVVDILILRFMLTFGPAEDDE